MKYETLILDILEWIFVLLLFVDCFALCGGRNKGNKKTIVEGNARNIKLMPITSQHFHCYDEKNKFHPKEIAE